MCGVTRHQIFPVRVQAKFCPVTDSCSFAISLALSLVRGLSSGAHIAVCSDKRKKFGAAAERKVRKQLPGKVIRRQRLIPIR